MWCDAAHHPDARVATDARTRSRFDQCRLFIRPASDLVRRDMLRSTARRTCAGVDPAEWATSGDGGAELTSSPGSVALDAAVGPVMR